MNQECALSVSNPILRNRRTRLNTPDAIKMYSPQGWTLIQYRLYEFAVLTRVGQQSNPLCLTTIASWSHSFPSRTGP